MTQEVEISRLAHGGEGIGQLDGQVCFVPGTLPGDRVQVGSVQRRKGFYRAELEERIESSPHRQPVTCPVFESCGGCSWLDFSYPTQGEWKSRIVADCFARIGKTKVEVGFRENPDLRLGYRTRATYHGSGDDWGFYARGSHDVVRIDSCPLCHPKLNDAFASLRGVSGTGSVEITVDPEGDSVLVWADSLDQSLLKAFPHAQSSKSGSRRETFEIDGVPVLNGSFAQSSLLLNRMLTEVVWQYTGSSRSVLDLYCGSGNFSLALTQHAKVTGIDHNGISVMAATRKESGEYRVGDESAMKELIAQEAWDTIILDPPRAGAKRIMKSLADSAASQILYVSCDPATLARDARLLTNKGWKISEVTAVDMFPNTPHVETVCVFTR